MVKYPQMSKRVSQLRYDSFRKTGSEELHFEREGVTHSLPSSNKTVNQSTTKAHH